MAATAPSAISRLAVTAGAAATVVLVERFVPLPFVRTSALRAMGSDVGAVSIGTLGITPILAGWMLVELAAVIVRPWGALRSTPEGRGVLRRRAYAIAALLALVQSAMITVALAGVRVANAPVLTSTGMATLFGVSLTLMGGAALYLAIAELVDRRGLGSGIALLAGTGLVARLLPQAAIHQQGTNPLGALALAGAAVAAAAWLQSGGAARFFAPASLAGARARQPVAGLVPLRIGAGVLLLAATAGSFSPAARAFSEQLVPGTPRYAMAWALVSVPLAALLAWLLAQPRHVAALWTRAEAGDESNRVTRAHAAAKVAALLSAAFAGGLVAVGYAFQKANGTVLFVGELLMAGALLADIWLELGARRRAVDLVPVWPLSRPYELEPAIELLSREGIPAFPRNARWYGLMPVLAAYAPVTLLVREADAERAAAKLREVFGQARFTSVT